MSVIADRAGRAVRALTAAAAGAAVSVVIAASAAHADPAPAAPPAPPSVTAAPTGSPTPMTPGIYGPLVGGGTMAPPPQPIGTDSPATSDPGFFDIPGQIEKAINTWFGDLVKSALGPVLKLIGSVLLSSPDMTSGRIAEVWTGTLVTANLLYVLFVLAGGVIVMSHETVQSRYSLKQIAPRLVMGVVASNASLWAIAQSVSLGNALSSAILDRPVSAEGIGAQLTSMVVDRIFLRGGVGTLFMILLGGAVVILGLALLVTCLIRATVLIVLTAGAPVAFACHALPQTEGLAKLWWRGIFGCLATQIGQSLVLVTAVQVFFDPHADIVLGIPSAGGLTDLLLCLCLLFILIKIPIWTTRVALGRQPLGGTMASGLLRNFLYYKAFGAMRGRFGRRPPPRRPPTATWMNRPRSGPPRPGAGMAPFGGPRPGGGSSGPGTGSGRWPSGPPTMTATQVWPNPPRPHGPSASTLFGPVRTPPALPPGRSARLDARHRATVKAPPSRGKQFGLFPPTAPKANSPVASRESPTVIMRPSSGVRNTPLFPPPRPSQSRAPRAAAPVRSAGGSSSPSPLLPVFISAADFKDPPQPSKPRAPRTASPRPSQPPKPQPPSIRWPEPYPAALPAPGKESDTS